MKIRRRMGKKKKRDEPEAVEASNAEASEVLELVNGDDSHQTKQEKKKKKKHKGDEKGASPAGEPRASVIPTVSVAVPGSIVDNAQSLELATRVFLSLSLSALYSYFLVYLSKTSIRNESL